MSQAPHVIRGLRSGLQARTGQARRLALGGAARHLLRLHDGDHRRELRGEIRHRARGAGRVTRCAASSWPPPPGKKGRFADEIVPVEIKTRKGVADRRRATTTCGPTPRWKSSPACRRRSRRTARVTAGNASGIVDGGAALILASREAVERARSEAARAPRRLGRRPASTRADGDGPRAGDAQGARAQPACRSTTSI